MVHFCSHSIFRTLVPVCVFHMFWIYSISPWPRCFLWLASMRQMDLPPCSLHVYVLFSSWLSPSSFLSPSLSLSLSNLCQLCPNCTLSYLSVHNINNSCICRIISYAYFYKSACKNVPEIYLISFSNQFYLKEGNPVLDGQLFIH